MADKGMCECGGHGGHLLFTLGAVAIAYGVLNYLMSTGWTSYGAWIAAGALLIIVSWVKKNMMMGK